MAIDFSDYYASARKGIKPAYRRRWRQETDAWLAGLGLERRNVFNDVVGAFGLVLLGAGIGVAAASMLGPVDTSRWRSRFGERLGVGGGAFEREGKGTSHN